MAKLDVKSLTLGVLLSLVAQGIYDAVFYFQTGKSLEGYVATTLALIGASIVLLISALALDFSILKRFRKKSANTNNDLKEPIVRKAKKEQVAT